MFSQPDLFGAGDIAPVPHRRRKPARSLAELHVRIDDALAAHRREIDAAIETLRDALCEFDAPEVAAGLDALEDELSTAWWALKREIDR